MWQRLLKSDGQHGGYYWASCTSWTAVLTLDNGGKIRLI